MINITIERRHLYAFVIVLMAFALVVPAASWASHTFVDVDDDNTFHDDIAWLAASGVTRGCNPPANTEFCPNDPVTRATMAAFLRRLAEAEVVNAATAKDADTLDGIDSGSFVAQSEVLYAAIEDDADVGPGNAVSATREAEGRFTVTFDRNLTGCVLTGSAGLMRPTSGGWSVSYDTAVTPLVSSSGDSVTVYVRTGGSPFDSSFTLVGHCSDGAIPLGDESTSIEYSEEGARSLP